MTKKEEATLDLVIVRSLLIDIYSRYGIDNYFDSMSRSLAATMYEQWQHRVSVELHHKGLIPEVYEAKDCREMGEYDATVYINNKFLCDDDDYR
ncbi:hypothetical protein [Priestia aryabhattai]